MSRSGLLAVVALAAALAAGAAEAAKITRMPGQPSGVTFDQYSGYIKVHSATPAANSRNLHYWFVESQNDPANDPLALWLTGGPGCSGLLGLLTENGPFNLESDGKTLSMNPYSWNKVANVIYVEQPAGVGFSLTEGHTGNYISNDTQAAMDNDAFLRGFLSLPEFQRFQSNPFYVMGESYAGHYVPELARQILVNNDKGVKPKINLVGTSSGNPSTNDDIDAQSYIPFLVQHALVSLNDYEAAEKACGGDFVHDKSPACESAKNTVFTRLGKRLNPYSLLAPCNGPSVPSPGYCFTVAAASAAYARVFESQIAAAELLERKQNDSPQHPNEPGSQTVVPCMNMTPGHLYLNSPEVRKALFIPAAFDQDEWTTCSQILTYTSNLHDMIPIYDYLNQRIRVLIYSGDVDTCVNYLGTEECARKIKAAGTTAPWHAWLVDDQIAGYGMQLGTNISYVTVKGAGHMVPGADIGKPPQALAMITRFLNGGWP